MLFTFLFKTCLQVLEKLGKNNKHDEIKALQNELLNTSMSSEYTKYVKIERQILALQSSRGSVSYLHQLHRGIVLLLKQV